MNSRVNFSTHGSELGDAHRAVVDSNNATNWLIYAFDKGTTDLRVQATGDGDLEELSEEFSDSKMQFAFARVIDPNTELPKFVFIAWCGSGVPEVRKGFFNSYLNDVSKFFKSFHVQINARDEADVEPELIMKRVAESSGAKYSVHKEQPRPQAPVTPVVSWKTEIPNIAAMQRETMKSQGPPPPVGTSYKPIQTTPKPLASRWNAQVQQQDSGAAAVRRERERAEQEAREREEQFARERLQREQVTDKERLQREAEAEARRQAAEAAEEEARQREAEERRAAQESERARQRAAEEQKATQEAERARQEQEAREAAEAQRRQEEERREAENRRLRAQQDEQQRQEEERRKQEEQRYQQEQAALEAQRDKTAKRAAEASAQAASATVVESANGTIGISAVVLYDYEASESNEMTLVEGEVITQIDQVDEGWWFGVSENGKKQGLFPANYVQVLEEESSREETHPVQAQPPRSPSPPKEDLGNTAIAMYDYDAGEDNEISFKENQRITHIEFVSEDWWQGVAPDGKTVGLFPANYVELQQQ